MAVQILGISGNPGVHVTADGAMVVSGNFVADVQTTTADYISIVGSPNYNLPVSLAAGTNIIGSVKAEITNAQINVDVTVADYVSIVGSPNYSLPVIGSAQVSSIVGALPAGTALLGSVVADAVGYQSVLGSPNYSFPVTGSVQILPGTALIGSVVSTPVGYTSVLGSPNYSFPVIGSAQVSSIVGALPAGTALLGSVVSTPVGYQNVLGSPNYNFPVIGSVQVSSIAGGIGSFYDIEANRDGSAITFDWVGALTGSVLAIPATGSRFNVTDIFCSASGQGIVTLFFNSDATATRLAKATLANFGGFVTNYSKPIRGPANGSLMITTAATGYTPVGQVTVNAFQSA